MNIQELYQRYPKIDEIVALGNENREHAPQIARICDFVTNLCADLLAYLPYTPPPAPVAQTPRFDPYTDMPLAPPAPEPAPVPAWTPPVGTPGLSQGWPQPAPVPAWTPPVGTPGLSQGWPQPAPGVVVAPTPTDDKAEIRALLAQLVAKL